MCENVQIRILAYSAFIPLQPIVLSLSLPEDVLLLAADSDEVVSVANLLRRFLPLGWILRFDLKRVLFDVVSNCFY